MKQSEIEAKARQIVGQLHNEEIDERPEFLDRFYRKEIAIVIAAYKQALAEVGEWATGYGEMAKIASDTSTVKTCEDLKDFCKVNK